MPYAFGEVPDNAGMFFGVVADSGQGEPQGDHVVGVKAEIDARNMLECSDQKRGFNHKKRGESGGEGQKNAPGALLATRFGHAAGKFLQRIMSAGARDMESWSQAEQKTAENRDSDGEQAHSPVENNLTRTRQMRGFLPDDEMHGERGGDQSQDCSGCGQQEGLDEQLADQSPLCRSQSNAHGYLPATRRGAHQQ